MASVLEFVILSQGYERLLFPMWVVSSRIILMMDSFAEILLLSIPIIVWHIGIYCW